MTTSYRTIADERRFAKALGIAAGAASWTAVRADATSTLYRIPSQSEPGVSYETDGRGCSCPDFLGRLKRGGPVGPCKHALAVQLSAARAADVGPGEYADTYGPACGHDPATCRLAVCPDC